jgi:integrase
MTAYAAGLRVSELVNLKLADIDSKRMMIRVHHGKGRKDRYTILSKRLQKELRIYWKMYRPHLWLFNGRDPEQPLPSGTAPKIYYKAKERAGIKKGKCILTESCTSTTYPNFLYLIELFYKVNLYII